MCVIRVNVAVKLAVRLGSVFNRTPSIYGTIWYLFTATGFPAGGSGQ